jgi:hypothetical protein
MKPAGRKVFSRILPRSTLRGLKLGYEKGYSEPAELIGTEQGTGDVEQWQSQELAQLLWLHSTQVRIV